MQNKITGIGLAVTAEGLQVAMRYSVLDDTGFIVATNQRASYIDDSLTDTYTAIVEAAKAHIQ